GLSIILDGTGEPICILETTEVTLRPFNQVDGEWARAEGEGDLSLDYWRIAHRRFFMRVLPRIGRQFTEEMPLVCERFRVIYR
ncbi:MAG: ASCH domain-containing protein, partial [Chloroflexi bacterium]|nr:ASCH domain-containing protein [Chloroflexota bacterium]